MNTTLYPSPEGFAALAKQWNDLLHRSLFDTPFLTLEWQTTWWQHFGDDRPLRLYAFRDQAGDLSGIAPLFSSLENGRRQINLVGCADVSDYMDLIVMAGREQPVSVALLDALEAPGALEWDAIDLCNIPEGSATLDVLGQAARQRGWQAETSVQEVCPIIRLPGSWDEYLARLDKKERHEFRRKMRRAEQSEEEVRWRIASGEETLDADLDAFITLLVESRPDKAAFMTDLMRRFFHAVGHAAQRAGWLQLAFLEVNHVEAAGYMNFDYGNRTMVYNSGLAASSFQWLSPGIVLMGYLIQHAIEQKREVFDLMRGDEDYKYRLGGRDTHICRLHIER